MLGCGAAPTVGNRRNNSHSMDSNDPYLHLSEYSSVIYQESSLAAVFSPRSCCIFFFFWFGLERRVRLFYGVLSPVCKLCAKVLSDFNHQLLSAGPVATLLLNNRFGTARIETKDAVTAKVR